MDHDSSMWSDSPTSVIKTSGGNALSGVITWSNRLPLRCVDVFTCCRKLYVDKIVLYLTASGSSACSRLTFMSPVMVKGNRHTGECCQQCGKLVEERRRSWLRTRAVYNNEDVATASRGRPTAHVLKRRRLLPKLNLG